MTKTNSDHKNDIDVEAFRSGILGWYDKSRRQLPWRATPGQKQDPYKVWLSEIMLQQTTVQAVIPYFLKFTEIWPSVFDLAHSEQDHVMREWAGLGYYARARNLHKCAKVIANDYGGVFPESQKALQALPGIGEYTSAAITSIAFDSPSVVVDGNIERIMARIFQIEDPLPGSKKTLKEQAAILSDGRKDRPGDYAQALMDIGATICTPKSPKCMLCPITNFCAAKKSGIAEDLPKKEKKGEKPQKFGYFYWVEGGKDEILLYKRPEKGLLGGLYGLPTSDWEKNLEKIDHLAFLKPYISDINRNLLIKHSFTHFDLTLYGIRFDLSNKEDIHPKAYQWVKKDNINQYGIASLFQKAIKVML